jgi:hypothetical protein
MLLYPLLFLNTFLVPYFRFKWLYHVDYPIFHRLLCPAFDCFHCFSCRSPSFHEVFYYGGSVSCRLSRQHDRTGTNGIDEYPTVWIGYRANGFFKCGRGFEWGSIFFRKGFQDVLKVWLHRHPPCKYPVYCVFAGDDWFTIYYAFYRFGAVAFIGDDAVGQFVMDSFTVVTT